MILYFNIFINHLDQKNKSNSLDSLDQSESHSKHRYKIVYEGIVLPDFKSSLNSSVCPAHNPAKKCGAIGSLSYHAKYKRAVIRDIVEGEIIEYHDVEISRFICSQCDTTHALLVWFLPPWSRHTMRFILFVLEIYYLNTMTVEALCAKFDITHPTLYAWVEKYRSQYDDLRKLFNPPLLPDIPLQFEQWENIEGLTDQTQALPPCNPLPLQANEQNVAGISEDEQKFVSVAVLEEPIASGKRQGLLSEFGIKILFKIKALVEQDTPAVFKDFFKTHRSAFFQARHIQGCTSRPRASPHVR